MRLRIFITALMLCLYVASFNWYLYVLTSGVLSHRWTSILYDSITAGMIIFSFLDIKNGFVSFSHEQFNTICFLSVVVNFIIIILTHSTVLQQPIPIFIAFDGGVLIATVIISLSGIKHGMFKD